MFAIFGGDFLIKLHLEKEGKSTGENSKNPVETAPRNLQISLSLVVVERALRISLERVQNFKKGSLSELPDLPISNARNSTN